ncbi:hypothetical protein FOA52_005037 [Chlamydomonas sp. UWO 241]|nr:hypothetical protein FOA52_005037 [Chlamydomonas sp. UWO 241]
MAPRTPAKPKGSTSPKTILVTVGTTKFDDLVKAVDDAEFAAAAVAKGYTHLKVQHGAGAYAPHNLIGVGEASGVAASGLTVEFFDYAPSLDMEGATLVISHAGSGSIFEALSIGRPLIVVPNPALMDNHQAELGSHLAQLGHLVCSTPASLTSALTKLDASALEPYAAEGAASGRPAAAGIAAAIDKVVFQSCVQTPVIAACSAC